MINVRRPNGSGGVRKLAGRRRKPWQAVVSAGHEIRNNKVCVKQVSLGTFATRKEALKALGEWQATNLRADLRYMTVDDVWDRITPTLKESMCKTFSTFYKKYEVLHKKRLVDIKADTIEQVELPPLSQSAHSKIRAMWHRIFEYGMANDIVTKDYSAYLTFNDTTPKRKKDVFSESDIKILMQNELYCFLLYTGMRIGELLSMKMSQVYEEEGVLCFHVDKSKTQAGIRVIPVHSELMKHLSDREYVIEPHIDYQAARISFIKFCAKHGIKNHTLHDFRRTFASYAKSCGADDYYIKKLLGHVSADLTKDVYTQAFIKDLKRDIEKVHYL